LCRFILSFCALSYFLLPRLPFGSPFFCYRKHTRTTSHFLLCGIPPPHVFCFFFLDRPYFFACALLVAFSGCSLLLLLTPFSPFFLALVHRPEVWDVPPSARSTQRAPGCHNPPLPCLFSFGVCDFFFSFIFQLESLDSLQVFCVVHPLCSLCSLCVSFFPSPCHSFMSGLGFTPRVGASPTPIPLPASRFC